MKNEARRTTRVRVADGAELCVETIGEPGLPAILLIGGAGWSMDWWEDELCRRIADHGRLVVRFDTRDTGRSTSYPVGSPGYTGTDLVTDAVAILDHLGIDRAHVIGLSMGGGIAQELALAHRDRVSTLTVMSTTSIDPCGDDLPGMSAELQAVFTGKSPEPDWANRDAVVDHIVEGERPFAGSGSFDEGRIRAVAERAFDRSNNIAASLTNHFLIDHSRAAGPRLSELEGLPTLVVHGTADPMFPPAHGAALAHQIPNARLIELDGVGHQLPPPRFWPLLIDALVEHTTS